MKLLMEITHWELQFPEPLLLVSVLGDRGCGSSLSQLRTEGPEARRG